MPAAVRNHTREAAGYQVRGEYRAMGGVGAGKGGGGLETIQYN